MGADKKPRFFTMYLTSTITVSLVLVLVGLACTILLSAGHLMHQLKENIVITAVLPQDADSAAEQRLAFLLAHERYVKDYRYVSKEQALEEHIQNLGVDPSRFLGYNPLQASYEIHLTADYVSQDSITAICGDLEKLPYVERVLYQQDIVQILDRNVNEAIIILSAVLLVLLLIASVLIVNTIRLHIYSQRFMINTMRLVGATPWVIRGPFVRRNLLLGFEAGCLAIILLAAAIYYIHWRLGVWLFPLTWQNMLFVGFVVLCAGELISMVGAFIATNRYLRMKIDRMYEI